MAYVILGTIFPTVGLETAQKWTMNDSWTPQTGTPESRQSRQIWAGQTLRTELAAANAARLG